MNYSQDLCEKPSPEVRMGFRQRWALVGLAVTTFLVLFFGFVPERSVNCTCPKCPDVKQQCNCKMMGMEKIGLGENRAIPFPQNVMPAQQHMAIPRRRPQPPLYRPDVKKEGWIVDCITWDEKWESNELEVDPHEFSFDEGYSEESPTERKRRFSEIYKKRIWGGGKESMATGIQSSGTGAMLKNAQSAVASLHVIVMKLKAHLGKSVISILDVGCGDLQWMNHFLLSRSDVDYTCIEIVPELIKYHQTQISASLPRKANFILGDIVDQPINGSYDLILCRDTFQYLHQLDVMRALNHISMSGSKFFLVTTFPDSSENGEIENKTLSAFMFPYNLELPPFLFEPPICTTYDWSVEHLALWTLPVRQKYEY